MQSPRITPDAAVARALAAVPGARAFGFTRDFANHRYSVRLVLPDDINPAGNSQAYIDFSTGEVIAVRLASDAPAGLRFLYWQFPLHSGEAFGAAGQVADGGCRPRAGRDVGIRVLYVAAWMASAPAESVAGRHDPPRICSNQSRNLPATRGQQVCRPGRLFGRPSFDGIEGQAGPAVAGLASRPASLPFSCVLAGRAANGKGQGAEAFARDRPGAFDAVAVGTDLESAQCGINPAQRLGLHLYQREIEVGLDVDIGAVVRVDDVPIVATSFSNIPHHLVHAFSEPFASRFENRLQLDPAPGRCPHGRKS